METQGLLDALLSPDNGMRAAAEHVTKVRGGVVCSKPTRSAEAHFDHRNFDPKLLLLETQHQRDEVLRQSKVIQARAARLDVSSKGEPEHEHDAHHHVFVTASVPPCSSGRAGPWTAPDERGRERA